MQIEKIIYDTTREIYSVEDKLSIATVFLFCYQYGSDKFAELLYTKNHSLFIEGLNIEFERFKVDFSIKLSDKNINNAFNKTLDAIRKKYDSDGFYKALFKGDQYAISVVQILDAFFDKVSDLDIKKQIAKQLTLF